MVDPVTQEIEQPHFVAGKKTKRHAGHVRLLNDAQHLACRKLYVNALLMPRVVALELNKQFGTGFTTRQITEYCRARGWSARRKRDQELVLDTEPEKPAAVAAPTQQTDALALETEHKPFLDKKAAIGLKGLKKAEQMIDRAIDAKTLASALGAAKTASSLYEGAVGLEDSGARSTTKIFNVYFSKAEGSPFAKAAEPAQPQADQPSVDADAVVVDREHSSSEPVAAEATASA